MRDPAQVVHKLDSVFHAYLRLITNCESLTHHRELYSWVGWPALVTRRRTHWYVLIYRVIFGLLPSCLCTYIHQKTNRQNSPWPHDFYAVCP